MISRILVALVLALAYTSVALAATGQLTAGTTSANQKCLEVVGTAPGNGAQVQLNTCSATSSASQTWQFISGTVAGKTLLRTTNNLCLDVPDGVAANNKDVQVWTCSKGSTNQFFARDGNVIRWNGSNYCLNMPKGVSSGFASGLKIQLYTCNTASNNQRILGPGSATVVTSTTSAAKTTSSSKASMCTRKSTTTSFQPTSTSKTSSKMTASSTSTKTTASSTSTKSTSTSTSTRSSSTSTRSSSTSTRSTTSATSTRSSTTTSRSTTSTASAAPTSSTSTRTTSTSTTSTTSTFVPQTTKATTALTDIFNPAAKRMLAWGFDDRYASGIGSGAKISSYHHWELGVVTQMPAKNAYIPTYWGSTKSDYWQSVTAQFGNSIPAAIAGFNEPDVTSQANMSPAAAAQLYYDAIYVPYGSKGANMISPAVAWDVYTWLPAFMSAYQGMGGRIDAMGYHIYLGLNNNTDAAVAEVKKRVNYLYKLYGKKIVLSEIGLTSAGGGTDEQIADFVQKVGNFLDNSDAILAWALSAVFARGSGWDGYLNGNMSFYWQNKTLTPLANQYMTAVF